MRRDRKGKENAVVVKVDFVHDEPQMLLNELGHNFTYFVHTFLGPSLISMTSSKQFFKSGPYFLFTRHWKLSFIVVRGHTKITYSK